VHKRWWVGPVAVLAVAVAVIVFLTLSDGDSVNEPAAERINLSQIALDCPDTTRVAGSGSRLNRPDKPVDPRSPGQVVDDYLTKSGTRDRRQIVASTAEVVGDDRQVFVLTDAHGRRVEVVSLVRYPSGWELAGTLACGTVG
jgi:hypothetical protein